MFSSISLYFRIRYVRTPRPLTLPTRPNPWPRARPAPSPFCSLQGWVLVNGLPRRVRRGIFSPHCPRSTPTISLVTPRRCPLNLLVHVLRHGPHVILVWIRSGKRWFNGWLFGFKCCYPPYWRDGTKKGLINNVIWSTKVIIFRSFYRS